MDYIHLGVAVVSMLLIMFITWRVSPHADQDEDSPAMGFHFTPSRKAEEEDDGC